MVWKIILGIILFFILLLSVKLKVFVHSEDGIDLSVGWLFLKFQILPKKEKKKKKTKQYPSPKRKAKISFSGFTATTALTELWSC